jgi:hypothetical protein
VRGDKKRGRSDKMTQEEIEQLIEEAVELMALLGFDEQGYRLTLRKRFHLDE